MTVPGTNPNGHDDRDGMPQPSSRASAASPPDGEMPVPSMGQSDTGGMPMPGARAAASAASVPDGAMPVPRSASSPVSPLPGGELPRFGPPGGAGGNRAYEPGVVEVQFREDVSPALSRTGAAAPTVAADGDDLDAMNEILQRNGLVQAEPTFTTPREEAVAAQRVAREQGMDVPLLAQFMTLHFADDADTARIAEELSDLPEVERAVAVPVALPRRW
ncbi:hypothetical protein [Blastococcus sp. PRF04-17]|uniref:hypothetical protein n=1 Tax=Blastococcus sp. PRF04-17 TaxID=2933797 RepID=UPI001FF0F7B5|nr:hypothetical protein [Blastococcus sp. PRF04-17]UOY02071.1 hypothetical protein MVA48_01405 [Blastococcus sp. PRF04-17]